MKVLHLLRHAKAEVTAKDEEGDHGRSLNKRGREAAQLMAAYMAENGFHADHTFCSTATRAKETLIPIQPMVRGAPVAFRDRLYLIGRNDLLRFIRTLSDTADSVLLVGHNPTFHDIAVTLVGKAPGQADALANLREKYPTGALCRISFDVVRWGDIQPRGGTLRGFVRPRDLET